MPNSPYLWRKLTPTQRQELLTNRKIKSRPWHAPPHHDFSHFHRFHLSAACYEHHPIIGHSAERMDGFSRHLTDLCEQHTYHLSAWTLLPNHYHILITTDNLKHFLNQLAKLHGRASYHWNIEEDRQGRQNFHRASDRAIRSDRHFWATMNYIHHNPVRHGYVERWQDWPWSSATAFLNQVGSNEALRIWKEYPIKDYGQSWDPPDS